MHGFTLAFFGLTLAADPLELPKDVQEIQTRRFAMPIGIDPDRRDEIEKIRFFVSEDQGKTWKHKRDYKPTDKHMIFTAPSDGLYWFAAQVMFKDGGSEPAELNDLVTARKVYVNTERRVLKAQKSYAELQREVEQLRKTVERLQTRIKQLESDHKPK